MAKATSRLAFTAPHDFEAMLGFIGPRAFPGIEHVAGPRYRRALMIDGVHALIDARLGAAGADRLLLSVHGEPSTGLASIKHLARRYFDLDTDPAPIAAHLSRDTVLRALLRKRPGIRIPGAWSLFELAVRAILGQQVSVKAATTLAARLVTRYGAPLPAGFDPNGQLVRLFPAPDDLVRADLTGFGVVGARARSINHLAKVLRDSPGILDHCTSLEERVRTLVALPGIGDWTAHYIGMRALREADAFPTADLGLIRAYSRLAKRAFSAKALQQQAEQWRPWRAYAAMLLWMSDPVAGG